jgi:hypothetical protein
VRLPASLSVGLASAVVNARFKGDTSLHDNRVPQVASYNLGVSLRYSRKPWTASGQLRITGPQFEDDLNVYTLRRATTLDVFVGRALTAKASAFIAIENVFDDQYDVGRTPILTVGLPRAVRVGVQFWLP